MAAIGKPRVPLARSPGSYPTNQSPPMVVPPSASMMSATPPSLIRPQVRPATPPVQRPQNSYSPFDGQIATQVGAPIVNSFSFGVERSQGDPSKAPGFRPTVSTGMPQFHNDAPFSRAPGTRGPSMTECHQMMPPLASLSIATNVQNLFTNTSAGAGVMAMVNSGSLADGLPPTIDRDRYTTPDQPMTLPRISSSLNPHASEFTAPFLRDGMTQHSPRSMGSKPQQTSPVDLRPSPPINAVPPLSRSGNTNSSPIPDQVCPLFYRIPILGIALELANRYQLFYRNCTQGT